MPNGKKQNTGVETPTAAKETDLQILESIDIGGEYMEQRDKLLILSRYLEDVITKIAAGNALPDIEKLTAVQVCDFADKLELTPTERKSVELLRKALNRGVDKKFGAGIAWKYVLEKAKSRATPERLAELQRGVEVPDQGIRRLNDAAKELGKNPNAQYTAEMGKTDILNPTPENKESFNFMQWNLVNILTKIVKKYPEADISRISMDTLSRNVQVNQIQLVPSESIALSRLEELKLHPENPVTIELNEIWPKMINDAQNSRTVWENIEEKAGEGWESVKKEAGESWEYIKKNPGEAVLIMAAGAAGIYLTCRLVKWLAGKAVDTVKNKVKETAENIFSTSSILTAASIGTLGAAAYYAGKDKFHNFFAQLTGMEDAKETLEKYLQDIQKATNPEEVERIKGEITKLMAAAEKAKEHGGTLTDKAKKIEEEGLWQLTGRDVPPEERERAKRLSQFIDSLKADFDMRPESLAVIGNQKYEEVAKNGTGIMPQANHIYQLIAKREAKTAGEIVFTYSAEHLMAFLDRILKNGEQTEAFKNKTIYEVLEMIQSHPELIDQDALKAAQNDRLEIEKIKKEAKEMADNPKAAEDENRVYKLFAKMAKYGLTFAWDTTSKAPGWIYRHGVPVAKFEVKWIWNILNALGDDFLESDKLYEKGFGTYVKVGMWTACLGAPIGSAIGVAKGFTSGRGVTWGIWEVIKNTAQYTSKGFGLPLKGLYSPVNWSINGVDPIRAMQSFIDEQRFILEDMKLSNIGNRLGTTSLTKRLMLSKELKIDNRLIWRLENYKENLKNRYDEIIKSKGVKYKGYKNRLQAETKRCEEMLELLSKKDRYGLHKRFNPDHFYNTLKNKFSSANLSEKSLSILKNNPRFSLALLLDENSTFTSACLKNPSFIELLDKKGDLLDAFMRDAELINNAAIKEALVKNDMGLLEKTIRVMKPKAVATEKPETARYKTTEDLFKGSRSELTTKLTALEDNASKLAGAEKVAAMQEIYALDSFLNPMKQPKLTGYEQLTADEAKANRLTEFAAEIEARSAGVDSYVKREVQAIQELAKEQKLSLAHPDIQKEFIELDKFMENYTKGRAGALNELSKNYKEIPRKFRTPELKAKMKFAFEGPEGTFVTKLKITGKKALMGRATVGAIIASGIFTIEYFTNKDPKKDLFRMLEEFGPTAVQILVDILPFVGTGSMLYGAISGKETVTGAKLDTTGRLVTGAFGVGSLAADVLTILSAGVGGVPATAARLAVLAEKGGKVGKTAEMLLKNWSGISSLMTRMGPKVFGESVLSFMKGEKVIKGVRLAEKTAVVGGAGIMAGSLVYSFVGGHEVDIPEDIDIKSKTASEGAKENAPEKEPAEEPLPQAA
jgi:hypothetical protein